MKWIQVFYRTLYEVNRAFCRTLNEVNTGILQDLVRSDYRYSIGPWMKWIQASTGPCKKWLYAFYRTWMKLTQAFYRTLNEATICILQEWSEYRSTKGAYLGVNIQTYKGLKEVDKKVLLAGTLVWILHTVKETSNGAAEGPAMDHRRIMVDLV